MALRDDANDANLSRIADDLIGVRELLEKMDHAQVALLENGHSHQGQLEALTGQITHMIQILTPEQPEQEGPSLADLLARILTQQSGMAALMRQIYDVLVRLAPPEPADTAHANGAATPDPDPQFQEKSPCSPSGTSPPRAKARSSALT